MIRSIPKYLVAAALLGAGSSAALAQFSNDPFALSRVSDAPGDQTLSKIAMMADGSFFVSWNDAQNGYDVRLQKYNAAGVEQWAHNGVLVADRSLTSVFGDYELRADVAGNAYLAFPQQSQGDVTLTKIDGTGAQAWSTVLSAPGASIIGSRMALLSDGSLAVAWLEGATIKVRRVAANGTPVPVENVLTIAEASKNLSPADMQAGENGSFIIEWVRPFGTGNSSRHVRAQKYDANNAPVWADFSPTSPGMIIYQPQPGETWPLGGGTYNATQGGAIQNGYFPYFKSDGNGGAVFCVYETAGPRSVYVQQVSAAGVKRWNTNYGLPVTNANPSRKISASADIDLTTGDIYVSWIDIGLVTESAWGVSAQKINASDGTLAWGDTGVVVEVMDTDQESFVTTVARPNDAGCYVVSFEGRAPAGVSVAGNVQASAINGAGALEWDPTIRELCSEYTPKGRLWVSSTPNGGAVMTFSSGGGVVGSDLLIANIEGTVTPPACPADLGIAGGLPGSDGLLDNNDFIAFINYFFNQDSHADMGIAGGFSGSDGMYDNNDFIAFINQFFNGCS